LNKRVKRNASQLIADWHFFAFGRLVLGNSWVGAKSRRRQMENGGLLRKAGPSAWVACRPISAVQGAAVQ
jgi:hypothetical protein